MKKRFPLLALALVSLAFGCRPPAGDAPPARPVVPAAVPAAPALDLAAFRGEPLLIYVWAPWTDSGEAATAELRKMAGGAMRILPVVVDRREPAPSDAMPDLGAGLPVPVFATDELMRQLGGIRALPTVVLLNSGGEVAGKWPGMIPARRVLEEAAAALTGEPIPVPE